MTRLWYNMEEPFKRGTGTQELKPQCFPPDCPPQRYEEKPGLEERTRLHPIPETNPEEPEVEAGKLKLLVDVRSKDFLL